MTAERSHIEALKYFDERQIAHMFESKFETF